LVHLRFSYRNYVFRLELIQFQCVLDLDSSFNFFFVSSFFWTSCIAVQLYLEVKFLGKFKYKNQLFILFHIISWGFPVLFAIIMVGVQAYTIGPQGFCDSYFGYQIGFWFAPLIASWFWNFVCYILILYEVVKILRAVRKMSSKDDHTTAKLSIKLAFMMLIFVICWALDIWNFISQYFLLVCPTEAMFAIQNLLAPLQGFLNSILYGTSTKKLRVTMISLIAPCIPKKYLNSVTDSESKIVLPETNERKTNF